MNMNSRKAIINATVNLLRTQSINKITVKQILDESDVSKGTFYKYFKDKFDVVNMYYEEYYYNVINSLSNNDKKATEAIFLFYIENKKIIRNAFDFSGTNSLLEHTVEILYEFYKKTWLNGTKEKQLPIDVHLTFIYHCNGLVSLYKEIIYSDIDFDSQYISNFALNFQPDIIKPYLSDLNYPKKAK